MFGFGNDKNKIKENPDARIPYITALGNTFGTTDVDWVLKEYMPELSNAILTSSKFAVQIGENQIAIAKDVLSAIEKLKKQNEDIIREKKELQAKYDALVERMAGYIERENGKGR